MHVYRAKVYVVIPFIQKDLFIRESPKNNKHITLHVYEFKKLQQQL